MRNLSLNTNSSKIMLRNFRCELKRAEPTENFKILCERFALSPYLINLALKSIALFGNIDHFQLFLMSNKSLKKENIKFMLNKAIKKNNYNLFEDVILLYKKIKLNIFTKDELIHVYENICNSSNYSNDNNESLKTILLLLDLRIHNLENIKILKKLFNIAAVNENISQLRLIEEINPNVNFTNEYIENGIKSIKYALYYNIDFFLKKRVFFNYFFSPDNERNRTAAINYLFKFHEACKILGDIYLFDKSKDSIQLIVNYANLNDNISQIDSSKLNLSDVLTINKNILIAPLDINKILDYLVPNVENIQYELASILHLTLIKFKFNDIALNDQIDLNLYLNNKIKKILETIENFYNLNPFYDRFGYKKNMEEAYLHPDIHTTFNYSLILVEVYFFIKNNFNSSVSNDKVNDLNTLLLVFYFENYVTENHDFNKSIDGFQDSCNIDASYIKELATFSRANYYFCDEVDSQLLNAFSNYIVKITFLSNKHQTLCEEIEDNLLSYLDEKLINKIIHLKLLNASIKVLIEISKGLDHILTLKEKSIYKEIIKTIDLNNREYSAFELEFFSKFGDHYKTFNYYEIIKNNFLKDNFDKIQNLACSIINERNLEDIKTIKNPSIKKRLFNYRKELAPPPIEDEQKTYRTPKFKKK